MRQQTNYYGKNMIIYESFGFGDTKKVSTKVTEGLILVSDVAPFIDSLKFSWMDLHLLKEIRGQEINIDFDKWLTLLKKEQDLGYIFAAVRALKNSLAYEAYIDDNNELVFSFDIKFHDGEKDSVAEFYSLLNKGKSQEVKSMKFDKNNEWKVKDDELVTSVEGLELKISKDKKDELFKMITDHVNQHLDNAIENVEESLKRNKFWSALYKKANQEKIIELFNKEKESNSDNVKEVREEASEALSEIFGLTVKVW